MKNNIKLPQAAKLLGVHYITLYRQAKEGKLKVMVFGTGKRKTYLISEDLVNKAIETSDFSLLLKDNAQKDTAE